MVNNKVANIEEKNKKIIGTDSIRFFITDRYNQFNNIRLIPLNIDKKNAQGAIAIYKVENDSAFFINAFTIKMGEKIKFKEDNKIYEFDALYIAPWKKFLGLINGKDAIYFQMKIN